MHKRMKDESILIIGAGVFGLSTALALQQRGYSNLTVVDRYMPPVPDGSSNDISRVIRSDYSDEFYSKLAREAIDSWETDSLFSPFFHQSGLLVVSEDKDDPYMNRTLSVVKSLSAKVRMLDTTDAIRNEVPGMENIQYPQHGYINLSSGWADAAGAVEALKNRLVQLGVSFVVGRQGTMQSLIIGDRSQVLGIKVVEGPPLRATSIIMATGAWTNRYLDLRHTVVGTAQPLGFIRLTPQEAQGLAGMPVTFSKTTGVFFFPPTSDNILKVAYHGHGYEISDSSDTADGSAISAPRRDRNNAASTFLPTDASRYLRDGLRRYVPSVADKPWIGGRMCWYTDTPTGDFIADHHPSIDGLFVATGGSGQ